MKEITVEELAEKLAAHEEVNLIDVREDEEVAAGKIPEAIHIPLGSLEAELGKLDKDADYIMICRSGGRSGKACEMMELKGYKASNVVGGMIEWTDGEVK